MYLPNGYLSMNIKFLIILLFFVAPPALASQWKLSHEVPTSDTRKLCVYQDKEGNTKSIEQAKSQYCRTYL